MLLIYTILLLLSILLFGLAVQAFKYRSNLNWTRLLFNVIFTIMLAMSSFLLKGMTSLLVVIIFIIALKLIQLAVNKHLSDCTNTNFITDKDIFYVAFFVLLFRVIFSTDILLGEDTITYFYSMVKILIGMSILDILYMISLCYHDLTEDGPKMVIGKELDANKLDKSCDIKDRVKGKNTSHFANRVDEETNSIDEDNQPRGRSINRSEERNRSGERSRSDERSRSSERSRSIERNTSEERNTSREIGARDREINEVETREENDSMVRYEPYLPKHKKDPLTLIRQASKDDWSLKDRSSTYWDRIISRHTMSNRDIRHRLPPIAKLTQEAMLEDKNLPEARNANSMFYEMRAERPIVGEKLKTAVILSVQQINGNNLFNQGINVPHFFNGLINQLNNLRTEFAQSDAALPRHFIDNDFRNMGDFIGSLIIRDTLLLSNTEHVLSCMDALVLDMEEYGCTLQEVDGEIVPFSTHGSLHLNSFPEKQVDDFKQRVKYNLTVLLGEHSCGTVRPKIMNHLSVLNKASVNGMQVDDDTIFSYQLLSLSRLAVLQAIEDTILGMWPVLDSARRA